LISFLHVFLLSLFSFPLETDDTDIKIADFGFAKRVKELSPKETACGTPGYVAPEILRGDKYGAEVDVWSMGVICYVLLAGYPPFYDEDQKRLFKKIKEGRYHFHEDYWGNTSPEAIHMIQQMLCVDQSKRWTAEQLLSHPWIVMGDETLQAKDLQQSIVVLRKFNARRRLKSAADAVILANRMQKLLGKMSISDLGTKDSVSGTNRISIKKAISMIDPDLLKNKEGANGVDSDGEGITPSEKERRLSIDSDINPVLDLLNDKELEDV
jgi:serine/threonine protein kinase